MNDVSTESREAKMTVGLNVGDRYTHIMMLTIRLEQHGVSSAAVV